MEANQKKILRAISLALRHELEGWHDDEDRWHPGDLERRLNAIGVWRDRPALPADELQLSSTDRAARRQIDAYVTLRQEAGAALEEAVAEFVRESAYSWANRLLALRCLEARGLADEVILRREVYGGRSLVHNRLVQRNPTSASTEDEGLIDALFVAFRKHFAALPQLFDPESACVALRPGAASIKRSVALLGGEIAAPGAERAAEEVFAAPDALGWAYQFWQEKEKERVDRLLKTKPKFKCEGADIIPKTALYTESYMVKFLVQNSLGATWMGMHPESKLCERWEYYVRDADRAPVACKPLSEVTFLDPACGSGHFLLEAFDLFYDMYLEEATTASGRREPPGSTSESRPPLPVKQSNEATYRDADASRSEASGRREPLGSTSESRPPLPVKQANEATYRDADASRSPEQICELILGNNLFGIDIDARAVQIAEAALVMKARERAPDYQGVPRNLSRPRPATCAGRTGKSISRGSSRSRRWCACCESSPSRSRTSTS